LQLFSQNEDFIQLVPEDSMHFEAHTKLLCCMYNQFREALARSGSEAAIRRAVDDLFSLAFETDADTLANSAYLWVSLPISHKSTHLRTV
jgi:hypothetical protein